MDKLFAQIASHKFSHCWHHLIRSETPKNDHLLQVCEFVTPGCRQANAAWLLAVINELKVFWIFDESLSVKMHSSDRYK